MLNPMKFAEWLMQQARDKCGYIMCAVGQDPKKLSEWYFSGQYTGSALEKANYWREHAPRVFDCQGLADCYVTENAGQGWINVRARNNYADWCGIKGEGTIPNARKTEGAAVFRHGGRYIEHVGFLVRPVNPDDREGDWIVVEARGVHYGVVETKLNSGKWNRWGWMTKYFDHTEQPEQAKEYGDRTLRRGMSGSDVRALQMDLIALGYSCGVCGADGDFGRATESAVKAFQRDTHLTVDGIAGRNTYAALNDRLPESGETEDGEAPETVTIAPGTWHVRVSPRYTGAVLGYVHGGDVLERGEQGWTVDGWLNIIHAGESAWIGGKAVER